MVQRLQAAETAAGAGAGGSGEAAAFHCGSPAAARAQLAAARSAHAHVHKLWQHKKMQLDQCFQLRLFEQDCEKVRRGGPRRTLRGSGRAFGGRPLQYSDAPQMLEWIVNHRTAFLATYVEIGRSCAAAKRLQEEHARYKYSLSQEYKRASRAASDTKSICTESCRVKEISIYAARLLKAILT